MKFWRLLDEIFKLGLEALHQLSIRVVLGNHGLNVVSFKFILIIMVAHVDGLFMLFVSLMAMLLREHGVVDFGLCGSLSRLELMEKLATHQPQ